MTLHLPTVSPVDQRSGGETGWLTTVLRPAGTLAGRDGARFTAALQAASVSSGVVMVDLRAVGALPRPVRRALTDADARLTEAGGALLVIEEDLDPEDGRPVRPPAARLLDGGSAG
jgi:hypothetical protein